MCILLPFICGVFFNLLACHLFHHKQKVKFHFMFCLNNDAAITTLLIEMQNQPDH